MIVLRPFVRDYPGEPVPEETLTHPPSWSSSNLYRLLPSTTIHSILLVQITWLAIFFAQPLSMSPLVYLLFWSPPPHMPYISSPIHLVHATFIPLHILCTHMWQLVDCIELLPTPLPHTPHGHLTAFCTGFWRSPLTLVLFIFNLIHLFCTLFFHSLSYRNIK